MNYKYTAEQVEAIIQRCERYWGAIDETIEGDAENQCLRVMKDYAAHLRERESAAVEPYCYTVEQKNGLSQGAMCRTIAECEASPLFDPENDHIIPLYRAPLASARVPDQLDERVVNAFAAIADWAGPNLTQAINSALAAAPKPEKE